MEELNTITDHLSIEQNLCTPLIGLGDLSYARVGDYLIIELVDGRLARFDVTEVRLENRAIRLDSHDCPGKTEWNHDDTNKGGIAASALQNYLNNEMYNLLPDYIKSRIIETERKYMTSGTDDAKQATYMTKIFIPDVSEVFNDDGLFAEKLYEQMKYYKDRRNRMKGEYPGADDICCWWLASVPSGNAMSACSVSYFGTAGSRNASTALRVPVCFWLYTRLR